MIRTVGTTLRTSVAVAAVCAAALTGCGGGSAGPTASTAPASSVAAAPTEPAASATPTDTDAVFVADVRAKVASGDYTPTKESSQKSRKDVKKYLAALTDDRLAAVGGYNCQVKKEVTKAGMKSFSRRDFEKLELQNTGLEEGFKPLLGLTWDEAVKTICPG